MEDVALRALDLLPADTAYADVRVVLRRHELIHVENETADEVLYEESEGLGLRVLLDGQWGFAATPRLDAAGVEDAVLRAVAQARAAARFGRGAPAVRLAPARPVRTTWNTPVERDPFAVPVTEKVALLVRASAEMRRAGPHVTAAEASMDFFQDRKVFASTEGALIHQTITESGAGLLATASDGVDTQRRSFPQSVPRAIRGQRGDFATAGYEHVARMRLVEEAPRVGEEAVALLSAPACPSMTTTLVVGATQMALVVHEAAGHALEADRALGAEASLAGGTFVEPGERGRLRFGTDLVTITADATIPGGLGSYGFDDEGVPAQRTVLVDRGVFRDYLSARETAGALGVTSTGNARADGWGRVPLVRMTNICLEPGETPLEEMIAGVEDGILLDMNKSLSIDDRRLSFRFGAEMGWEIKRGRVGRLLKNCAFSSITPRFWASCDAVGDAASYRLYGIPSCNKGEPLQVAHIGHGTVPARFRDVSVGSR